MSEFESAIRKIKGYSEVLDLLSREVSNKKYFYKSDLELLKKLGADVLFIGSTLNFILEKEYIKED
jgi:hypothetical protein